MLAGEKTHPSDLAILLASADLDTVRISGTGAERILTAKMSKGQAAAYAARFGQPLRVGNEGSGLVVRASGDASELIGQRVSMRGGSMYARFRRIAVADCLVLPPEATASQAASLFINPMTVLAMVETARAEGHSALVHTAAASNLGQMLAKVCLADGVPLVNVVRDEKQASMLRDIGARHIVDSSTDDFESQLIEAISQTGATICFDAVGGGSLASTVLSAMEAALLRSKPGYSRYGTDTLKQVYVYGSLDMAPTILDRSYGMAWSVGGFLLTAALRRVDRDGLARMQRRIAQEYATTFSSAYSRVISLADLLDADVLSSLAKMSTGQKFLVDPQL